MLVVPMIHIHPRTMIAIGFIMVLLGFVLPFLMVMRVIQPSFPLSFLSYGASVAGVLLGLVGIAWYTRPNKR
jgi:hypothetical protein